MNILYDVQYEMTCSLQFSELSLPRRILLSLLRSFKPENLVLLHEIQYLTQEEKRLYKIHLRAFL